jgi:SnoaL-like protein
MAKTPMPSTGGAHSARRSCSIDVMLSLDEISDRLEIQQLLVDYSTAIDQRRFDDLDRVFTPDAYIDQ